MQAEIIEALNAVRSAGHEFTKSFNHLSDIIEEMAKENETLSATVKAQDQMILAGNRVATVTGERYKAESARATKAEQDAWDMAQTLALTKDRVQELERYNDNLGADLTKAETELVELRPMRSQRDIAFADLTTANSTIASLRQEVSKLLEIILNVATSVDGVVNKPKANEVINPDTTVRADYEDIQHREVDNNGDYIVSRPYPRSVA